MKDDRNTLRLYDDLAWLWPLWGDPKEYAGYCAHAKRLMREYAEIRLRTLLNIGCGGGKNVFNLKHEFAVTGLDLSPQMLELARKLNPECEFVHGDMRTFALNRTFDAVILDDAISYMATRDDLRAAFVAAWRHLNPGGVMVVTPDETKEAFVQNRTVATPSVREGGPAEIEVVFVENNYDPDPSDDRYEGTMVYLIREQGGLRVEIDRHVFGLFPLELWRRTLIDVGFRIYEASYVERGADYVTFACVKPNSRAAADAMGDGQAVWRDAAL